MACERQRRGRLAKGEKGYHRKDVVGLLDLIVKSSQLITAAPVVAVASWLDRSGSWHQLNDSHRHSATGSEGRKMWGKGKERTRSGFFRLLITDSFLRVTRLDSINLHHHTYDLG